MRCSRCQTYVPDGFSHCPRCGTSTNVYTAASGNAYSGAPTNAHTGSTPSRHPNPIRNFCKNHTVLIAVSALVLLGSTVFRGGGQSVQSAASIGNAQVSNSKSIEHAVQTIKPKSTYLHEMPMYDDTDLVKEGKRTDVFGNQYQNVVRIACWPKTDASNVEHVGVVTVLPEGRYTTFHATIFARPGMHADNYVIATIKADSRVVWSDTLKLSTRPRQVTLNIAGVSELTFTAAPGANTNGKKYPGFMLGDAYFE